MFGHLNAGRRADVCDATRNTSGLVTTLLCPGVTQIRKTKRSMLPALVRLG